MRASAGTIAPHSFCWRSTVRTLTSVGPGLLFTILAAGGCGEHQELLGLPEQQLLNAHADVQAASAPTAVPIFFQFAGLNPCSGLPHTVTVTGTAWIHELPGGQVVIHLQKTITTSSGFEGRGTSTIVVNGNIRKFTLNDMLTHPSGDRIRAHLVLVVDLTTSPPTVLVRQGTWGGTICVGA